MKNNGKLIMKKIQPVTKKPKLQVSALGKHDKKPCSYTLFVTGLYLVI